jgi:hypothetical protein
LNISIRKKRLVKEKLKQNNVINNVHCQLNSTVSDGIFSLIKSFGDGEMREIKFRAWDKQDKRMIVDEQIFIPVKVTNKGVIRLSPNHIENLWDFADSSRFEIMEYTGLKDKNHFEIYEGDILSHDKFGILKVVFQSGKFDCVDSLNCSVKCLGKINEWTTILGNIFENPELLEVIQ